MYIKTNEILAFIATVKKVSFFLRLQFLALLNFLTFIGMFYCT